MGKPQFVPITPAVLKWAVRESGYDDETLADELGVAVDSLHDWQAGAQQPTRTQFAALVQKLRRPSAAFFLPDEPKSSLPEFKFRRPHGSLRARPNAKELRWLREVGRVQTNLAWFLEELGVTKPQLPTISTNVSVEKAATELRSFLLGGAPLQKAETDSERLGHWRLSIEKRGVFVFLLPLGKDAIRGFSLYNDYAPLLAVNTHWSNRPRIFSMLHELAHLLSRTDSACIERVQHRFPDSDDRVERWCEQVASAVLMPWPEVENFLSNAFRAPAGQKINSLDQLYKIAGHFKASARAAAIRLIHRDKADWQLYAQIPAATEEKRGGGGGSGRTRPQIREDEYGGRTITTFARAADEGLITYADASAFLKVSDTDLESWR